MRSYLIPILAGLPILARSTLALASRDEGPDFKAIFSPVLSSGAHLFLPGDPEYFKVNERWSNLEDPQYDAAIQPATELDVKNIVSAATEHNISFLATGSGHSVKPGYASVKGAVNIDLSLMKNIALGYDTDTVTVGPGVKNSQVYDVVYDVKKELPLSTDRCISTIGTMIGGGLGTLYSTRGILADSLVSANVVTAAGDLVTASLTENPDLFWAIRGAGHNFGIVTSATFKIYDQTNGGNSLVGDFVIPNSRNASAFEILKSVDEDLEHNVFWGILIGFNHTTKEGATKRLPPHLAKAKALNPTVTSWENMTWNAFGEPTEIMCNTGWNSNMYQMGLKKTDVDTLVSSFNHWNTFSYENDWYNGLIMMERHSEKKVMSVPKEEQGVFPWRDTKIQMILVNYVTDPKYAGTLNDFMQPVRADIQGAMGFENHHSYVNEAFGDEGPKVWYGEHNLPRLVAAKQKWDPSNQFGAGMPVPLSL
ncbi:hypothetical protein N7448_001756 [Penicillium atrosanguineum]|nr:hypothetical protein N7448_001756 [Penicillium atrosanguineum]